MLDGVLNVILAGWIGIGTIVVAISFFLPVVTGKERTWTYVLCLIVVFLTGIAILTNGNAIIEVLAGDYYNSYKDTTKLVNIIRSANPSALHGIAIGVYTIAKYVIKIFSWEFYTFVLMGLLLRNWDGFKILRNFIFWGFAIFTFAIFDELKINSEDYFLTSEGYISVTIAALVLLKEFLNVVHKKLFRKPEKKGDRPLTITIVSTSIFILLIMLAFLIDAMLWGFVDNVFFTSILGT